jgi:hypothetical protein
VSADPSSSLDEYEVGEPPVAGMGQGALLAAVGDPRVEQRQRFGVEGNHALGAEFAERDTQPCAVGIEVDGAVKLEVQQLAGTHPGGPQQGEPAAGEGVVERGDGGHERPVSVGCQSAGHRFG